MIKVNNVITTYRISRRCFKNSKALDITTQHEKKLQITGRDTGATVRFH